MSDNYVEYDVEINNKLEWICEQIDNPAHCVKYDKNFDEYRYEGVYTRLINIDNTLFGFEYISPTIGNSIFIPFVDPYRILSTVNYTILSDYPIKLSGITDCVMINNIEILELKMEECDTGKVIREELDNMMNINSTDISRIVWEYTIDPNDRYIEVFTEPGSDIIYRKKISSANTKINIVFHTHLSPYHQIFVRMSRGKALINFTYGNLNLKFRSEIHRTYRPCVDLEFKLVYYGGIVLTYKRYNMIRKNIKRDKEENKKISFIKKVKQKLFK